MTDFLFYRDAYRWVSGTFPNLPVKLRISLQMCTSWMHFGHAACRFIGAWELPSAQGFEVRSMRFFEGWWERAPLYARVVLFAVTIIGMILGGSASGYWD